MTDKREEVARALELELWTRWDKEVGMYLPDYRQARLDKPWTRITESLVKAQAAIEAHEKALEAEGLVIVPREPTEGMLKAAFEAVDHEKVLLEGWLGWTGSNRKRWRAMADAALEGK